VGPPRKKESGEEITKKLFAEVIAKQTCDDELPGLIARCRKCFWTVSSCVVLERFHIASQTLGCCGFPTRR